MKALTEDLCRFAAEGLAHGSESSLYPPTAAVWRTMSSWLALPVDEDLLVKAMANRGQHNRAMHQHAGVVGINSSTVHHAAAGLCNTTGLIDLALGIWNRHDGEPEADGVREVMNQVTTVSIEARIFNACLQIINVDVPANRHREWYTPDNIEPAINDIKRTFALTTGSAVVCLSRLRLDPWVTQWRDVFDTHRFRLGV